MDTRIVAMSALVTVSFCHIVASVLEFKLIKKNYSHTIRVCFVLFCFLFIVMKKMICYQVC